MLYCVKCGDPIEKDELICDKCGYHFTIVEGSPAKVYMNQVPGQRPGQAQPMQGRPVPMHGQTMQGRPMPPGYQGPSGQGRPMGFQPGQQPPMRPVAVSKPKKKNGLKIAAAICASLFVLVCLGSAMFLGAFFLLGDFGNDSGNDIIVNNTTDAGGNTVQAAPVVYDNSDYVDMEGGYVADAIRDPFVTLKGNGEDVVTVMLYMNGSNLESDYGMATEDIREILDATLSDNVNVVIQTGGTKDWQTNAIASNRTQRFLVENGGLTLVDDDLGQMDMTDPDTLEDFINFCSANYPANRNMLIMWNHGSGAVYGFGYDEHVDDYYAALTLDEMQQAIRNTGVKFEMIGFDACLMGGLETACAFYDTADYLIASEDFESGRGWEYRNWLTILGSDSSTAMSELAKVIIDDFVKESYAYDSDGILALVDLRYARLLFQSWVDFAYASKDDLLACNYSMQMSRSDRASLRFATPLERIMRDPWEALFESESNGDYYIEEYNYAVDLMALANTLNTEEAEALKSALRMALIYTSSTDGDSEMTGLSVTLPYSSQSFYDEMEVVYSNCGLKADYIQFLESFVDAEVESYDWEQSEWGGWESYEEEEYNWEDWDQWEEYERGW